MSTAVIAAEADLHKAPSVTSQSNFSPGFDMMIRMSPPDHLNVVPGVLQSWVVADGGKSYTFKVRQGIQFHNGSPLTADDVAFSLTRILGISGVGPLASSTLIDVVDQVQVTDAQTVLVTLKLPSPTFLERLAFPLNVVMPKAVVGPLDSAKQAVTSKNMIGSGPFRSPKEETSISVEWSRNPNYWAKDASGNQLPYLDGIKTFQIADISAAIAAFRTTQVHVTREGASGLRSQDVDVMKKTLGDRIVIRSVDTWASFLIIPNTQRFPWNDVRARKALHLGLDRQTLVDFFGKDFAKVGSQMPQGQWDLPQDDLLKLPGFRASKGDDILEAKRLLKDATVPDGFTYRSISSGSATNDTNVAMVDMLAKVGLRHQPEPLASNLRVTRTLTGDFDLLAQLTAYPLNDPDLILGVITRTGGANNYGRFSSPDFDRLADQVAKELDPMKRAQSVRDWQLKSFDLAYPIMGYWITPPGAYWKTVHNWNLGPGQYNGYSDYDVLWLDPKA